MGVAINAPLLRAILKKDPTLASIDFIAESQENMGFSENMYYQTRAAELAQIDWTPAEKQAFCRQQFQAQHAHYEAHYPNAQFLLITRDAVPMGRLYFEQTSRELRLMEITLDQPQRNQGVGGAISGALLAHAREQGIAMGLHVETFNPAKRLYERQGFKTVEVRGIYEYMRVEADASSA